MDMFTCMQVQLCLSCVWQFDEIHQDAYSVGGLADGCHRMHSAEAEETAETQNCMQIISHICECLVDLHQTGYVHRDLKPANIMWLPSQNRWTLIDFGCAARIDEDARTGFSLMYAAPEAVRAHFREDRLTIQASAALDAWSMGVIAVELFSGRPPLAILQGQDKVRCVAVMCLPQAACVTNVSLAWRARPAVLLCR
jgi:serine/threonine protein kinase